MKKSVRSGRRAGKAAKPACDAKSPSKDLTDHREQLCNSGECGVVKQVQLSEAEITSLRGILLDIDPNLLRIKIVPKEIRQKPKQVYERVVAPWLSRHPVLAKAEVRNSGTGLHAILRFDRPVEFETEGDRRRWSAIVRVVQKLLPTDPDCPGITALTRPVGSINGKNDQKVTRLRKGEPVTVKEVMGLFEQVRSSPFRTVANILFGAERITPCPVCRSEGSRLDVIDHLGKCYGGCGKVRLSQIYDVFLKPRPKQED